MVSFKAILRGAVTRFVPGVATALGISYFISVASGDASMSVRTASAFAMLTLCFTAGFIALLTTIRPLLHETAHVRGRRSFIAGLLAIPVVVFLGMVRGNSLGLPTVLVLATVAGAITTLASFYPRLRYRMHELERTDNGELLAEVIELAERAPAGKAPERLRT